MTSQNQTNDAATVAVPQDLLAARRELEWSMAQKLFALASHLMLRLRVDPACPSPAQISSLLELASRFARLAGDTPQPHSAALPSEIETALNRVYGPTKDPAPAPEHSSSNTDHTVTAAVRDSSIDTKLGTAESATQS